MSQGRNKLLLNRMSDMDTSHRMAGIQVGCSQAAQLLKVLMLPNSHRIPRIVLKKYLGITNQRELLMLLKLTELSSPHTSLKITKEVIESRERTYCGCPNSYRTKQANECYEISSFTYKHTTGFKLRILFSQTFS